MAALHDMQCSKCDEIVFDLPVHIDGTPHTCGGVMEIYWHSRSRDASLLGADEMTVVYEHPITKKILYPGRNDAPMPDRYQRQGFVRREMRSLREVDSFSERHNLVNERANYDRGSGHSYDS